MTEENDQTQARVDAQLEAMRESMRALLNNPPTPVCVHNEIADTLILR
jgi:hypothetical protein